MGIGLVLLARLIGCALPGSEGGAAELGDVNYTEDLQPILQAKCAPCHAGEGFGGTDFVVTYGDLFRASAQCPGRPVFRCMGEMVRSGRMPPHAGCTGDPGQDTDRPSCLTSAELDLLTVWLAGGAPE